MLIYFKSLDDTSKQEYVRTFGGFLAFLKSYNAEKHKTGICVTNGVSWRVVFNY